MHWFWRATLAIAPLAMLFAALFESQSGVGISVATLVFLIITGSMSVAIYARLTVLLVDRPKQLETRCRKCQYILKGITEPRCPECGERI